MKFDTLAGCPHGHVNSQIACEFEFREEKTSLTVREQLLFYDTDDI